MKGGKRQGSGAKPSRDVRVKRCFVLHPQDVEALRSVEDMSALIRALIRDWAQRQKGGDTPEV